MIVPIIISVAAFLIVCVVVFFFLQQKSGGGNKSGANRKKDSNLGGEDRQYVDRISQLIKVSLDPHTQDKRESTEREMKRLGEQINEKGGLRRMLAIKQEIAKAYGEKYARRLAQVWVGIGQWTEKL
jgi:hypothetical protein